MVVSHTQFKRAVLAYIKLTGITPSAFGRLAIGDHHFVRDLRAGRRPRVYVRDQVLDWMADHPGGGAADLKRKST